MLSIYNISREVADSPIDTAVLPIGAVEGHGPHLPLGTDLILAEAFAYEYCKLSTHLNGHSRFFPHRKKKNR